MCSKALSGTEMKWWAATTTNFEWTNDNMINNTNQYIVSSIQCPISNNTNLCFTYNFWKKRSIIEEEKWKEWKAIIWIISEKEASIFQNK